MKVGFICTKRNLSYSMCIYINQHYDRGFLLKRGSLTANSGTRVPVLQKQVFHCKPGIKFAVPLGINRFGSFTSLSAILYIYVYSSVFCPNAGLPLQTKEQRLQFNTDEQVWQIPVLYIYIYIQGVKKSMLQGSVVGQRVPFDHILLINLCSKSFLSLLASLKCGGSRRQFGPQKLGKK